MILLAFSMLVLWGMGLTERALLEYAIFLGSSLVCWSAHKQSFVTQSTTAAEYVVVASRYFG
jgi:hypothetical protein